jgi:formylglycine-generating enzyme required for sulfatase activity
MIAVPAGKFLMGSPAGQGDSDERPRHKVTIARPFAVAIAPVARGEFSSFVLETNYKAGRDPGEIQLSIRTTIVRSFS